MKKKTVITTEKHEVWVIRSPAGPITEEKPIRDVSEAESANICPEDSEEPSSDVPTSEGLTASRSFPDNTCAWWSINRALMGRESIQTGRAAAC
jgi:hypothetical protein